MAKASCAGLISWWRHGSTTLQVLCVTIVVLCCCCSTTVAESERKRKTQLQSKSSVITHLPGFDGHLPFHLQTGYVDVDESVGVHLFYYFIRSEHHPMDDPVVIWLTGGPGCSALSGLIYEIGPLSFDLHAGNDHGQLPKLVYKPDSWTKVSNVIFLDSPVGTGFSYSETEQGYKTGDTMAVHQIVVFLTKWFNEHPEFLSNPLYIAGDSYSGMIVPTVAFKIAIGKEIGSEASYLNLKGYLAGNPVTDHSFDPPSRMQFAHGMGLISDEMYQAYKTSCRPKDNQSVQCTNSLDAIDECVKGIYQNHILEPLCTFASPRDPYKPMRLLYSEEDHLLRLSRISPECRTAEYTMSRTWANDATVREALRIRKGTVPLWKRCNEDISAYWYNYDIASVVSYHLGVTTRGYRSLIYSGDHDMLVSFISTLAWIKSLNFSVVDEWRPWFVDGQVGGYTRSYSNNLTFATVKGGGHTATEYMPRQGLAMFARWVSGDPL